MATLQQINERIRQLRAQIRDARTAGNTKLVTQLQSQLAAVNAQTPTKAQQAPAQQAPAEQGFEDRFQQIMADIAEAYQSGDEQAAHEAADAKKQLEADMAQEYVSRVQANEDASDLEGMLHRAHSFLYTHTHASQVGGTWTQPGQVVDDPHEKLAGWGFSTEQIVAWDDYQALIEAGMTPEEASAQSGLTAEQAADWGQIVSWSPQEWSQNYNDALTGVRTDLPARGGAAQLGGPLYTTVPGVGHVTEAVTPTYGGIGAGAVPGTEWSWSTIYGRGGGEAAVERLGPGAYTLTEGWTSGYTRQGFAEDLAARAAGYDEQTGMSGAGTAADAGTGAGAAGGATGAGTAAGGATGAGWSQGGTASLGTVGGTVKVGGKEAALIGGTAGSSVIPPNGQLIHVDGTKRWYIMYQAGAVEVVYEIGDQARARELFGADWQQNLGGFVTISNQQFNESGWLEVGLIDEQIGNTQSISNQIQQAVREARFEDIPGWIRQDAEAMRLVTIGALEGWSTGRILRELQDTDTFKERFPAYQAVKSGWQTKTVEETLGVYLQQEGQIIQSLKHWRGYAGTDLSTGYAGQIMQSGWSAGEVDEVLRAENLLTADPQILDNLNAVLRANGLDPLAGPDMVDVIRGNAPTQVYEAINDTMRLQAMRQAGLEVSPEFAATFGQGIAEQVASAEQRGQYSTAARQAALDLIQNWREVDLGKLGVNQEQVVQAAFGEGFAADTEARLLKFQRERQTAGQGWGGYSAYQSGRGELVLSGLKQL